MVNINKRLYKTAKTKAIYFVLLVTQIIYAYKIYNIYYKNVYKKTVSELCLYYAL